MKKMKICTVCRRYTLQAEHCGQRSLPAHPAPFNPNDPYGKYRRIGKNLEGSI